MELLHDSGSPPTMTISYLDKLNPQQRARSNMADRL